MIARQGGGDHSTAVHENPDEREDLQTPPPPPSHSFSISDEKGLEVPVETEVPKGKS